MDNEILVKFKPKELESYLNEIVFDSLNEMMEKTNTPKSISDSETCVRNMIGFVYGDAVPKTVAREIASSASSLILGRYARLKEGGKSSRDSLIDAQNAFIDLAYNVATGAVKAEGNFDYFNVAVSNLKDGFGNFEACVGGDAGKYAMFLGEVTHDALLKLHPDCEYLDGNLEYIKREFGKR